MLEKAGHICHITLLNPALHSRIFYKLAVSQRTLGYRVTVIGQDPHSHPFELRNIQIIPIKPFSRLSIRRMMTALYIYRRCRKLKPDILVLHTPELWWVAYLMHRKGIKIIYDVHEDYRANIQAASHYPALIKGLLARGVRWIEKRMVGYVAAVFYAEYCYENILDVAEGKYCVLRNSFNPSAIEGEASIDIPSEPYMLYTGTIAEAWGVFDTIDFWIALNEHTELTLVVAGHTHQQEIIDQIWARVKRAKLLERFWLIGGNSYVPYVDIVTLIQSCTMLAALYHIQPHISQKIPTKFYEAMAFNKPLLYTDHDYWNQLNEQIGLGVPYRPSMDAWSTFKGIEKWTYVHRKEDYHWESDGKKMEEMLS